MKKFLFCALVIFFSVQEWEAYGENPGSIKWSILLGNTYSLPRTDYISSPAIGPDGTIYASYYDDIGGYNGKLYAVNPDGTVKWDLPILVARGTHPAVDSDGNIYVGSRDQFIYSIRPDGVVNWTYKSYDGNITSPGIGKDGTIYFGGRKLIALNQNGTLKWFDSLFGGWDPDFNTSTAVSADGTVYVGVDGWRYKHWLFAYNPGDSKDVKWIFEIEDDEAPSPVSDSLAIAADGTIYVSDTYFGNLIAINPDGTEKWRLAGEGGSPLIAADGTIYASSSAITPNGSIKWKYSAGAGGPLALGNDGTFYAKRSAYVNTKWMYYLVAINSDGTEKWASEYIGYFTEPTISNDGTVYTLSADGYLYAFYSSSDSIQKAQWPMYRHDPQHTGQASGENNQHLHKQTSIMNILLLMDK